MSSDQHRPQESERYRMQRADLSHLNGYTIGTFVTCDKVPALGSEVCHMSRTSPCRGRYLYYSLIIYLFILSASSFPAYGAGCDLNNDSVTNVADVQHCVNQSIGVSSCSS